MCNRLGRIWKRKISIYFQLLKKDCGTLFFQPCLVPAKAITPARHRRG